MQGGGHGGAALIDGLKNEKSHDCHQNDQPHRIVRRSVPCEGLSGGKLNHCDAIRHTLCCSHVADVHISSLAAVQWRYPGAAGVFFETLPSLSQMHHQLVALPSFTTLP
mmetsp:Transcript_32759/g.63343  ORF Transcript_32759/g.63343 Transcript_32759/m.63343 type:complete len:109 (-) Transcript_32759:28-354(-)